MRKMRMKTGVQLVLVVSSLGALPLSGVGCGGDDNTEDGGADASPGGDAATNPVVDAGNDATLVRDASDAGSVAPDADDAAADAADSGDAGISAATACADLANETIPASAITLATTGVAITSATLVPASADGGTAAGVEYCLVLGNIQPVDSTAPPIMFEVNLPTTWNGKAFHFGGGGFDGSLVTGIGPSVAAADAVPPLTRGYATFGSDSGHEGTEMNFASNDEALQNYASDQLKKTHDAAVYLVQQRYGSSPTKMYFAGGSEGGREAFAVTQLWPEDYDGVAAFYPIWNENEAVLMSLKTSRAWAAAGAWPDVAKQVLLANGSVAACDSMDGVADGIVSDVKGCTFSPTALRCPDGTDTGDTCLSDVQISALQQGMAATLQLGYSTGSGETQYPAYNVFAGGNLRYLGGGNVAPVYPASTLLQTLVNSPTAMGLATSFGASYVEYAVAQDTSFNYLTLDPLDPGSYEGRIIGLGSIVDMNKTNLSQFQARGGKLLLLHGAADMSLSTGSSELYYQRVVETMGAAAVSSFFKFYEVPGYAHSIGVFDVSWDSLSALEGWVENGVTPVNQVVADINTATAGRTRPLCEYPSWPKYAGSGDVNSAASFTCATQ